MLLSKLLNPTESSSTNEDNPISHVDGLRQMEPCSKECSMAEYDTFAVHEAQLEMYKMNTSDKTYTQDGPRMGRNVSAEVYQYSSDTLAKATAPSPSEPIDISPSYRHREFGTRHPDQGTGDFNTVSQSSPQFYTAKFEQSGMPANNSELFTAEFSTYMTHHIVERDIEHFPPTEKDEMASATTISSAVEAHFPHTVAPQQLGEQLDDDEYEVERVVASRKPRGKQRKYLIKWEGYDEYTWLPRSSLNNALDVLADYRRKRKERRRMRGYA
ncbi:hypothetical protein AOL_s00091g51 [Orbilia oligospora ATCC 24927]|uniref:Chromo domain-containing protein n=1 Tax=Arthrobotrys oligospora (strain ATCC 24927 / CBS 115.81 / DSM 1491) TaxID=756982 RepID=G1XHZ9_ARTOA|nr:hypothetical protein AOL_s00091g51 [Orbilia oligospora ATCC 24927]EGX47230.1 hypothetical protein AOL_s00091g51 [Orbilia oligospora ATCC 24927]